jgi:cbb3-type cytochrome oxidase subunit 3
VDEAAFMKFKGTIWMAALFLGIVLYYYLVDVPAEKKQQQEKERAEKILPFALDQVEEFRLIKKDQTLHLKRTSPDAWELLAPVPAKADTKNTDSFLAQLQATRYSRIVEDSAKDLGVYGLQDPSLIIRLQLKDQSERTLLVGDDHPMTQNLYVKLKGQNKVLLATVTRPDLDKSLFDLRDKSLLNFKVEEIASIKFSNKGKTFALKNNNDQWEFAPLIEARGDTADIKSFLRKVQKFRVKKFIDENPESLTQYGLDAPLAQLTLETSSQTPMTLSVGAKSGDEGFYGKVEGTNNVVLFGRQLVETLSKNPVDFISKTLLEFEEKNVSKIELRTKGEEIVVARNKQDASQWTIKKPVETEADSATLSSLLFDLRSARVAEFVKTSLKNPELFGLDDPQQVLTVSLGKDKPWTLKLGNQSADGKHYFASRTEDSTVFTIAIEDTDKLFRSLHDLKDKSLLSFKKEDVETISIEYPDRVFELQKQNEDWNLTQPEKIRNVKGFIGNDILWSLNNVEYEAVVTPPLSDKESGLDKPTVSVTLWKEKGQKIGSVAIGKKVADVAEYYARVDGAPELYRIKSRFVESLPKDLQKFKD